jgi:hypothetical protein
VKTTDSQLLPTLKLSDFGFSKSLDASFMNQVSSCFSYNYTSSTDLMTRRPWRGRRVLWLPRSSSDSLTDSPQTRSALERLHVICFAVILRRTGRT